MSDRFQFGVQFAVVLTGLAAVLLISRFHYPVNGYATSWHAGDFATAERLAVAVATAISIAVACGALKAGETLRALRFLCPNAPWDGVRESAVSRFLRKSLIPSSFLTRESGSAMGAAARSIAMQGAGRGALWLERIIQGR